MQIALSMLIIINLSTNTLTLQKNGQALRTWNVGTAREGKVTPTGWFEIEEKEHCPPFLGNSSHPVFVAGCDPENPFGKKILWFIDHTFGIHGTNQPWLIGSSTTADERRVSGGCVRNAPADIEWLYQRVEVGTPIHIHW
ncbi:L,D-transpeptidase [bacterium]|nr:L,D-transpeptidase [bacterium]